SVLRADLWDKSRSFPSSGSLEKFYADLAGDDDMMGDIDGLAMSVDMPEEPFSRRLCRYYCGAGAGDAPVKRRFHRFVKAQSISLTSNKVSAASTSWMRDQIKAFAIAWAYKTNREHGKGRIASASDAEGCIKDTDLDWFTNRFVDWVNKGLAVEGP